MIKNIQESKYFLKGELSSSLLGRDIKVLIRKDVDIEYANLCADSFDAMPDSLLDKLCECSVEYCKSFCIYSDSEPIDVGRGREVLGYITPMALCIQRPLDSAVPAYSVEFDCVWEEDNGMEWSVRDNQALYVGPFINIGAQKDLDFYKTCSPNYALGIEYL